MSQSTILCVENIAENANSPLVDFLEAKGYHVVRSIDGWDCIKKIMTRSPDLVMLDLRLPKLDGLTVLDVLKLTHILQGLPIVLCAEEADKEQLEMGRRLGASDRLLKPIAFEELNNRISALLFELREADVV